mgnify:CR=1 FL=1
MEIDHLDGRSPHTYPHQPFAPWFGPVADAPSVSWVDDNLLCGLEESGRVRCWSMAPDLSTYVLAEDDLPDWLTVVH